MNPNALRWSDQASGNTLQHQLDGKRAGLPAFGNGLDNLGRNIGESQEPTDVRVTQAEAASKSAAALATPRRSGRG